MTSNLAEARQHVWFTHYESDGFITIAKKEAGRFKQYHYQTPEALAESLSEWLGDDVFFSQNTFYKPARRIENIRELRSLYVDLDCYLFNYAPETIMHVLEQDYFRQSVPEPNIVIFSGQGIVLIWQIEPLPYKALPLWQAVEKYLQTTLEKLGGDPKAVDAARIFRVAGSRNTKNGAFVHTEYRHEYRYDIHEIQDEYLPELKPKKQKQKGRKKKIVSLYNIYSLHFARHQDLRKLITMRNGEMPHMREIALFLYRYWLCCFENDAQEALEATLELNSHLRPPLNDNEVIRATRSAETAWEAKSNKEADKAAKEKGYPGAGYNISNAKLIKWLEITEEEQKHLSTIISTKEKNRRRRAKYQEQEGKMNREAYILKEKEKTQNTKDKVRKAIEENPGLSNRKLAAMLGISEAYIRKIKKAL